MKGFSSLGCKDLLPWSFILRSAQQEEALHRIWYALRRDCPRRLCPRRAFKAMDITR
ncbi:unnamed protein product [Spirodela intermedia]|uniref:Uncharacterized protein n=1 Tax=Spirodela intermedia TaxID=51605 RepID=A0ABN7EAP3_SPIIN|nr:unnamed protein product [Spirodela intermedia]